MHEKQKEWQTKACDNHPILPMQDYISVWSKEMISFDVIFEENRTPITCVKYNLPVVVYGFADLSDLLEEEDID